MKFNCDRCKTRYSISDDRVRGKILKIRCKNCSAVITVREGVVVAAPVVPEPPAAPTQAPATTPPPPVPAVVEWFMSIGGDQAGPFDLEEARRWVAGHPAGAELHCWSEGFDDWLPVEKVSHFRALRTPNGAVSDPYEKTPAPLFAETMKQMTAEAPTLLEDENPFSAAYERKKRETAAGAASRRAESMPRIGDENPLISGLTMPEAPRPEMLRPAPRRSPLLIPLIAATAVLLIVLAVLLFLALTGGDESSSEQVTRGGSASAAIARGVDDREPAPAKAAPDAAAPVETATRTATARPETTDEPVSSDGGYTAPPGEVDLSGAGSEEPVKQGSLDPGDIADVYRRQQSSVNRCYASAIKRDPLLEVPKTQVTLEVAGSGRVTRVSIPSLAGKPLGSCLVASITRWTFPKSTEGFAGRFPIVFRSR